MSQSTPPNWLQLAIKAVEEAPDIERGVQVFLQRLHNEITNGGGLTNPILVTEVALQAAEDLAIALQTEGAGPVDEKPTSPSPGSSNTSSKTTLLAGGDDPSNPVLGPKIINGGTTGNPAKVITSVTSNTGSGTSFTSSAPPSDKPLNPVLSAGIANPSSATTTSGGGKRSANQDADDNNPAQSSSNDSGKGDKN